MNCIYCECGWGETDKIQSSGLLSANEIIPVLREHFQKMHRENTVIDSITYAGNGEPTLHPQFAAINQEIMRLRDLYFPQTIITCLSNSTQLHRKDVLEALLTIDNPLMKLDAGSQYMFEQINRSYAFLRLDDICADLQKFGGRLSIQTLFLRGVLDDDVLVDNTTESEVNAWLERLTVIRPQRVVLYSIDRATPVRQLEKISVEDLTLIARKVQQLGVKTEVY
jgi:wyosine [tRNA(Phe)-imidazoG37] synthetase (radical SAM superfamily)